MGLAFLLMSILKNQALTFVLLLGYIVGTLIFFQNKFYYLFDYMAFNIPLSRSEVVGFANLQTVLTHRAIYLFLGLGFICLTIYLLQRLPQSKKGTYFTLILGVAFVLSGSLLGINYVSQLLNNQEKQKQMIALNNQHVNTPRLNVNQHHIQLQQLANGYKATSEITGTPNRSGNQLVFVLNPSLQVTSVQLQQQQLQIKRKNHLILVQLPKTFIISDTIQLTMKYQGTINENICYPDVDLTTKMKRRSDFLFDIDKKFAFTESNYLLVTPETYWYPISGVGYSTTDATWFHKDFIRFRLTVKPLAGLTPISQGKCDTINHQYQFTPEQPLTQMALAIGNYEKKQLQVDSTTLNVWYFKGHDYFSNKLPALKDTLNKVLADRLHTFENEKRLPFLFPRMNFVEVPIQFTSFPRIWTTEQEVTQPEMVLLPEKLATLKGDLDWKKRKERRQWWSHNKKTDEEWQLEVLDDFIESFTREKGDSKWKQKKGGDYNISFARNPYYQFAQLFSFNYNLNAPKMPIMNRVLEAYINNRNVQQNSSWVRNRNGISKEEKVNLLLQKHSFAELLTDKKYKENITDVIQLKADVLFNKLKNEIGEDKFDAFLNELLQKYQFKNLNFDTFSNILKTKFNISVNQYLDKWFNQKEVPQFLCSTPKAIEVKDGEEMHSRVELKITNYSNVAGIVQLYFSTREGRRRGRRRKTTVKNDITRLVELKPHETKEIYVMLDEKPSTLWINTLISKNLPSKIKYKFNKVVKDRKAKPIESIKTINKPVNLVASNEIIVDNEDANFSTEGHSPEGLLQKWLLNDNTNQQEDFKYKGFKLWGSPVNWTLTTHTGFFGKFVRSAYYLRKGNGDKKAIWKVPIKKAGFYEVQYYVYKHRGLGHGVKGECHFTILHDGSKEEQMLTLRKCEDGWSVIGTYYFDEGEARVELTNETDAYLIVADAVKFVQLKN